MRKHNNETVSFLRKDPVRIRGRAAGTPVVADASDLDQVVEAECRGLTSRCLALVVASPKLAEVRCSTPGEMALVNTLCWVRAVSEAGDR